MYKNKEEKRYSRQFSFEEYKSEVITLCALFVVAIVLVFTA